MSLLAAVDGASPILPPVRTGSVLWYGPYLNPSGYGEEARGFLGPLQQAGWSICARSSGDDSVAFAGSLQGSPFEASLGQALVLQPVDPVIAVIHLPGSAAQPVRGAVRTVMRTMFETDGLPPGWAGVLNGVDEIWVPSAFNVETFRRAGVTVPLHVVPGGVDTELFRPDVAPLAVPGARGRVYLSVFEWSHRKAPDVLLRAWAAAFGPGDPVSLVLRCFPRDRFDGDTTAAVEALVDEELARLGRSRADVAPIVCLGESLPPGAMPHLMAAADVYLGVARGEGWGRPLLEAMATGLAVVGTRWSGNLAFMDDDNSLLVDVERLVEIDERMDLDFYRGQRWAEPSVEHLVDILRRTADDRGLVEAVGARARADADGRWRWTHAAGV
ncbi:glycosyltransferase, partial [Acidimicrobiaceae bacterium USS-CC1]|nr:glycosyltransferase [Acidiferrimicrobium australe]